MHNPYFFQLIRWQHILQSQQADSNHQEQELFIKKKATVSTC